MRMFRMTRRRLMGSSTATFGATDGACGVESGPVDALVDMGRLYRAQGRRSPPEACGCPPDPSRAYRPSSLLSSSDPSSLLSSSSNWQRSMVQVVTFPTLSVAVTINTATSE